MTKTEKQQVVAKTEQQQQPESPLLDEDVANMNMMAQFVNHLLTPGSALSGTMQAAFNIVMVILFMVWGMFLASMPDSIHVWIFGVLILGLTLSTNWFLNEVMKMKDEIAEEEKNKPNKTVVEGEEKKQIEEKKEEVTQQKEEEKEEKEVKKKGEKMKTKKETKKEM